MSPGLLYPTNKNTSPKCFLYFSKYSIPPFNGATPHPPPIKITSFPLTSSSG